MNRFLAYAGEALEAIWRHRVRSTLTILGMIIGTASIIGVLGLSKAAQGGISGTIASFGEPGITIAPDPNQDDFASARIQYRDTPGIREETRGVVDEIYPNYNRTFVFRARGIKYETFLASESGIVRDTLTLRAGRRISTEDVDQSAHVALLSQGLAHRFFGDDPGIGEVLRIGGSRFRVIGVYDEIHSGLFSTVAGEDYAEIPYTTYHELVQGPVDFLYFYPLPGRSADAQAAVTAALQHLHGTRAKYVLQDGAAFLSGFNQVLGVLAVGLSAIGGVALLVAGIGIMNIMLVSVTERTREIGIRKSIGANPRDISVQFLIEAVLLSLTGGIIGTVFGLGFVLVGYQAIKSYTGPAPIPYLLIVSIAVVFSMLVGTVFGTYPAFRAGRLDPIEALRS